VAEEIRVDAVGLAEGAEAGELILRALIGEGDLILLRLTCERLRLFAAELRGEFGRGGGVIGGGGAIGGAFAERVEGGIWGSHALLRDGGLLGGRVAGVGEERLNCGGRSERSCVPCWFDCEMSLFCSASCWSVSWRVLRSAPRDMVPPEVLSECVEKYFSRGTACRARRKNLARSCH
jgi:hypothetical protein